GLLLAMISFVKRASSALDMDTFKIDNQEPTITEEKLSANECPEIANFTIQGPLFFGAADRFESTLTRSINERPSVLILKMKYVPLIDATAEANLSALIDDFVKLGGTVLITELPDEPLNMLKRSGLYDKIGGQYFFNKTTDAVNYALNLVDVKKCSVCSHQGATSCQVFKKIDD
ncbi:MAG TPA: sodium-independent anion transporter, partial [Pseudogracilibacillus sp.]|nr:sodium-independent anion transporter [Pseudogracilibacillus sp.]